MDWASGVALLADLVLIVILVLHLRNSRRRRIAREQKLHPQRDNEFWGNKPKVVIKAPHEPTFILDRSRAPGDKTRVYH